MFLFSFGKDKKTWNFCEEPLPFTAFQFGNLLITDEDLLSDLGKAPKCNVGRNSDRFHFLIWSTEGNKGVKYNCGIRT